MGRISGASYRRSLGRGRTRAPYSRSRRRSVRSSQLTPAQQIKVLRQGGVTETRRRKQVEYFYGPSRVGQGVENTENGISRTLFSSTVRTELERSRNLENFREPLTIARERSTLRRSRRLSVQGIDRPPHPKLVPGASNTALEEAFADIFNEAKLEYIELDQCVSVRSLRVRSLLKFGIDKTVEILQGRSIGLVTGFTHVGKFPVVVELPRSYMGEVVTFFDEKCRERSLTMKWINSRPVYHVVNGGYEHEARWRLASGNGWQFGGLKWRVLLIPWRGADDIRSIAIMSNQLQKKEFVIAMTFMEELLLIRRTIDDLISRGEFVCAPGKPLPRGLPEKVANMFSGRNGFTNSTIKVLVGVAAKASLDTIQAMSGELDKEAPAVAKKAQEGKRNKRICSSSEVIDPRAFRKLVNSKSVRGASKFFNSAFTDEDRRNALRRLCRRAVKTGSYKGVSGKDLDDQVQKTKAARLEIEKFTERVLGNDTLPEGMADICHNLLETEELDSTVEENERTPNALLKKLRNEFIQLQGPVGAMKIEQYEKLLFNGKILNESVETESGRTSTESQDCEGKGASEESIEEPTRTQSDLTSKPSQDEQLEILELTGRGDYQEHGSGGTPETPRREEGEHLQCEIGRANIRTTGEEYEPSALETIGIQVHEMGWEKYNLNVLDKKDVFDFVYTDPYQAASKNPPHYIGASTRSAFIEFVRKVLVPGGYFFVIVRPDETTEWTSMMLEKKMSQPHLFYIIWDPCAVQRTKGHSLQVPVQVAVVARKPGRHPKGFTVDVDTPYTFLKDCSYSRKFAIIDKITGPSRMLLFPRSRLCVRKEEKHHNFVRELMTTFCPPGGCVLDPIAHTMTTGIACLLSGRPCVLLEENNPCFSLAVSRLEGLAIAKQNVTKKGVSIENIDVYCAKGGEGLGQREDSDTLNGGVYDGAEIREKRASSASQEVEKLVEFATCSSAAIRTVQQQSSEVTEQEGAELVVNQGRGTAEFCPVIVRKPMIAPGRTNDMNDARSTGTNQSLRENTQVEEALEAANQERIMLNAVGAAPNTVFMRLRVRPNFAEGRIGSEKREKRPISTVLEASQRNDECEQGLSGARNAWFKLPQKKRGMGLKRNLPNNAGAQAAARPKRARTRTQRYA